MYGSNESEIKKIFPFKFKKYHKLHNLYTLYGQTQPFQIHLVNHYANSAWKIVLFNIILNVL